MGQYIILFVSIAQLSQSLLFSSTPACGINLSHQFLREQQFDECSLGYTVGFVGYVKQEF